MPNLADLLTRCPQCHTAFRASAAQLAARNGRVRCGTCQHAFDAYSARVETPATPPAAAEAPPSSLVADFPANLLDLNEPSLGTEPALRDDPAEPAAAPPPDEAHDDILFQPLPEAGTAGTEPLAADDSAPQAAPSTPPSQRTAWLFLLASLLLILLLLGQIGYRFRTELSTVLPGFKDAFAALNIDVPLPHQAEMVSIEASDLQADAVRNLLILNATVKNRAPWSQAYPLLELTLTDTHDVVLLRRSFKPADYLPADSPPVFGPHADLAVRLWLDTHGATAAGYRLYVYYP